MWQPAFMTEQNNSESSEMISITFSARVDNWPSNRWLIFGDVLDSGGAWPLTFQTWKPMDIDHKATVNVMKPCITNASAVYMLYCGWKSIRGKMTCLVEISLPVFFFSWSYFYFTVPKSWTVKVQDFLWDDEVQLPQAHNSTTLYKSQHI